MVQLLQTHLNFHDLHIQNIHVNDLPNCLGSTVTAHFADINITIGGATESDIHDNLEIELNKVHMWLSANNLTLNTKKTEGTRQRLSQVGSNSVGIHPPKRLAL